MQYNATLAMTELAVQVFYYSETKFSKLDAFQKVELKQEELSGKMD